MSLASNQQRVSMRAVGYQQSGPITAEASLVDIELPKPTAGGRDLLVAVKAVSVNPVDSKVRVRAAPPAGEWKVLGYDAAGIVEAVGPEVKGFEVGDAVFYAGSIGRSGTNAEFHLVDERIVGHKPASLSFAEAAAVPLTAITAWEALFDRLAVRTPVPGQPNLLLVIGGAGGVASIAVQLARRLTDLTVIGTASRAESHRWVTALGAHHVVDHSKPLADEVAALGLGALAFVFSTTGTDQHLGDIVRAIAPQGRFAVIDDPKSLDVMPFKSKSVSIHWESMFTRSTFQTADMADQGKLLDEVSRLIDAGALRTTLGESYGTINAANLKRAHALMESGRATGKIVLEGFAA